ncbi:MAG TPA: prepilin-type N-terminal cleavage/methylation domain-containing protein [Candidatus Polarisedimenticolaceae bacterium]|nr:prepilin-type N-terminal cleavage/methylation domain-containing protein [Candidatus Polarisedimenticolaceae bacterium]
MMRRREKGFTLIELLIVVAIIGIIAAIAIPNLLNAIDRGKQKRTMADLRSVGTAIESYSIDNNFYPNAGTTLGTLQSLIEPLYIRTAPSNDGWNRAFNISCSTTEYTVCSGGKDGGNCVNDANGATQTFNDSITFSNGQFVQWPEGAQQ